MGAPRSNRQSRFGAAAVAIGAIVVLQVLKFAATSLAIATPVAVGLMYAAPLAAMAIALRVDARRAPAAGRRRAARPRRFRFVAGAVERVAARFGQKTATA